MDGSPMFGVAGNEAAFFLEHGNNKEVVEMKKVNGLMILKLARELDPSLIELSKVHQSRCGSQKNPVKEMLEVFAKYIQWLVGTIGCLLILVWVSWSMLSDAVNQHSLNNAIGFTVLFGGLWVIAGPIVLYAIKWFEFSEHDFVKSIREVMSIHQWIGQRNENASLVLMEVLVATRGDQGLVIKSLKDEAEEVARMQEEEKKSDAPWLDDDRKTPSKKARNKLVERHEKLYALCNIPKEIGAYFPKPEKSAEDVVKDPTATPVP